MAERTLTVQEIEDQWESVVETVSSPGDAVIVEAGGEPKVVVIGYDWYQRAVERERQEQLAIARQEFDALAASIGDRNSDLTDDEIWELATRPDREAREELTDGGTATPDDRA